MAKPPSPTPDNIRLTITVTPQVHAAFSKMAEATGMSLGRCMGEWLQDTLEGVEFLTGQLVRARAAPRQVIKEMQQSVLGLGDELDAVLADMRSGKMQVPAQGAGMRSTARPVQAPASSPRPVIRGGKSPGKTRRT